MITPTIHMNGTSRDELLNQLVNAADAVFAAIETHAACHPNARDYYPQGPEACCTAQRAHKARASMLDTVRRELIEMAESIDAQGTS